MDTVHVSCSLVTDTSAILRMAGDRYANLLEDDCEGSSSSWQSVMRECLRSGDEFHDVFGETDLDNVYLAFAFSNKFDVH